MRKPLSVRACLGGGLTALLLLTLSACNRQAEAPAAASAPAAAPGPTPLTPATATMPPPDVGRLEVVKVTADGWGSSASEAVAEAMRLAILQVNGASVDVETVNAKLGIDATLDQTSTSLRAQAFADVVRQRSGGVIQGFRIVDLSEPVLKGGKFKASIEAGIAKFQAPESMKKIKLVVAPLRNAGAKGAEIRQRIVDALVATGRFAVLEREFSPEIEQELDLISSGQAPGAETAKLGQAASADVLWIGKINQFGYQRHAQQLRTSDRELVSWSGGWSMSHKLVNVATRQVLMSESLQGSAPSTAPTTLGTTPNVAGVEGDMARKMAEQVVAQVIGRTFPITVVALEGKNVVLSQGGQALRVGARYAMVTMGTEMKDPQTGQSLGRLESPCCQMVVDRVTPNLAYGHLENVPASLAQLLPGALQVREPLGMGPAPVAAAGTSETAAAPRSRKSPATAAEPADKPLPKPGAPKDDDKW